MLHLAAFHLQPSYRSQIRCFAPFPPRSRADIAHPNSVRFAHGITCDVPNLAGKLSRMRNNPSRIHIASSLGAEMDTLISRETLAIVRAAAEPVTPGLSVKGQINKAWVALGRPPLWRVRSAWYGHGGSFSAQAVRDLQDRYRLMQAKRAKTTQAADLLHAARLEVAATALEGIDAEFHIGEIDRLRHLACKLRDLGAYGPAAGGVTDPEDTLCHT